MTQACKRCLSFEFDESGVLWQCTWLCVVAAETNVTRGQCHYWKCGSVTAREKKGQPIKDAFVIQTYGVKYCASIENVMSNAPRAVASLTKKK